MKKGFTLLEILIVIIILGILSTLGFAQYGRMIEKARGAEARQVMGVIRSTAVGLWMERATGGTVPAGTFVDANLGIGNTAGLISNINPCTAVAPSNQYYFWYAVAQNAGNTGFAATATRCTANGKAPAGPSATTVILTTNFAAGTDVWTGTQ